MITPRCTTPELLEWTLRHAFHHGLREKQPPFDEMLFSANLEFEAAESKACPTPQTECVKFTRYLQEWEKREMHLAEDASLRKRAEEALDAALQTARVDKNLLSELAPDDISAKARALLYATLTSSNTSHVRLLVALTASEEHLPGQMVDLYFTKDDRWVDAQRSFCLWSKAYNSAMVHDPDLRWEYFLQRGTKASRPVSYVLDSTDQFGRMILHLQSSTEVFATVYPVAWKHAIHSKISKGHSDTLEDSHGMLKKQEEEEEEEDAKRMEEFIQWSESDGSVCTYVATANMPPLSIEEWRARTRRE